MEFVTHLKLREEYKAMLTTIGNYIIEIQREYEQKYRASINFVAGKLFNTADADFF